MTTTQTHTSTPPAIADPTLDDVVRAIAKRSFCTLATASPANRPHVAGVLYSAVGTTLYTGTRRDSRKARNIAANPHVSVCIPIRRLPVGPPSNVLFAGRAEILELDDPGLLDLAGQGRLKAITGHGELELPDGCFIRITPTGRFHTYGLGLSLLAFLRNPLTAGGSVELE